MKITTGFMPFKGYKTFYRIVGEKTDKAPLILLHGGPGSTHNYFEVLDPLAELTHRQIISYDQIGCGESYLDGHPELWCKETGSRAEEPDRLSSYHRVPSAWSVVGRHACHRLCH